LRCDDAFDGPDGHCDLALTEGCTKQMAQRPIPARRHTPDTGPVGQKLRAFAYWQKAAVLAQMPPDRPGEQAAV
jgi:hypothetical protein